MLCPQSPHLAGFSSCACICKFLSGAKGSSRSLYVSPRAQNVLAPLSLRPLCCTLRVLAALEGPAPEYVAKHTATLVKLLVRLAKEHAQGNPSLILAPAQPQPGQPPRCAPLAPCAAACSCALHPIRTCFEEFLSAAHTRGAS